MENLIGPILGGAGSFIGAIGGLSAEAKNYRLQKDQFDWQKQMTAQTWAREDNAMQRRMADLRAAGINPITAVGTGGAGASHAPVIDAPQRDADAIQKSINALFPIQLMQEISKTKAEKKLINSQANHEDALTDLVKEQKLHEGFKRYQTHWDTMYSKLRYAIDEREIQILDGARDGLPKSDRGILAQTVLTVEQSLSKWGLSGFTKEFLPAIGKMISIPIKFGTKAYNLYDDMFDSWFQEKKDTGEITNDSTVGETLSDFFTDARDYLKEKVTNTIDNTKNKIKEGASYIGEKFRNIFK